jgi:archaeal chaperonin
MTNAESQVWRPMAQNVEIDALDSNSNAAISVADAVRTTLGPKGLDKLLIDQAMNRHVSNDGVTILLSLRTIHPVARMIVEIAERQEELVGDGTTTAVVMAAEMIKEGRRFIREMGVHPTKVVEGIETAVHRACEIIDNESVAIHLEDPTLEQVVSTALASKLDGRNLSKFVVSSIRAVADGAIYDGHYDFEKCIAVIRKANFEDQVVDGIVLERKRIDPSTPREKIDARVLICKLDLKPVKADWLKEGSRYSDVLSMEKDRERKSRELVDSILATGADTLLIASPEVDELIENQLISRGVFAVRIAGDEVEPLSRYLGVRPARMPQDLAQPDVTAKLGKVFEDETHSLVHLERAAGKRMVTVIVSGTTKETSLERWRAVLDGLNAAEAALNKKVVPGGGAAELYVGKRLRELQLKGVEQVGVDVVNQALESVMRQILTNAGYNGLEKVMAAKASPDGFGIDINTGEPADMLKKGVLDPALVKTTALQAAGEITRSVLRIDRNLAAENLDPAALSTSSR